MLCCCFFSSFSLVGFVFLVVYALYTPWGPFLVLIHLFINKKKTCELIWLRHLLQELRFGKDEQMKLICENLAALHIASNPIFHERTKHIEVDCHFIREKIASGCVATNFVNSNDQLTDIFTNLLEVIESNTFVISLVHMTYMLQLEGEC